MKSALHSLEEMAMELEVGREKQATRRAIMQLARPSSIRKPRVFKDGAAWCAMEGENLQEGICGFGDTPDAACRQFDIQWLNERPNVESTTKCRITRNPVQYSSERDRLRGLRGGAFRSIAVFLHSICQP